MAGDTYFKAEVLYAGGAVQQYIDTAPLSFTGWDGASPSPPVFSGCPPQNPPDNVIPEDPLEPPPPPCIEIEGYDGCVQIAPDITGVCGEAFITWDDGIVWERTINHEPQDTYYHGEAREYVWNVIYKQGNYTSNTFKSGIIALMPGYFKPQYGQDFEELHNYWKKMYTGSGSSNGNKNVRLESTGEKGPRYGEEINWSYETLDPVTKSLRQRLVAENHQASNSGGSMYPSFTPESAQMFEINAYNPNVTFDHYVETTYQWNGQRCYAAGFMVDTLPVETENWTEDANYPLGSSGVSSFVHYFVAKSIASPAALVQGSCQTGYHPWGVYWQCDMEYEPNYYWRSCPDHEEPCDPDDCPDREPPYFAPRPMGCAMEWTSRNTDRFTAPAPRFTHYNCSSQYGVVGHTQGMSAGDEFKQKYSDRQEGLWATSQNSDIYKVYSIMPCQPVARHYTNTRSLPDPASFDGVEEYTIDNVGVAHRWVWSHADLKWLEHGKQPAPDGGVI